MSIISFGEFIGDRTTFFEKHFRRAPLFRQAALAGRAEAILSVEQMNDVIALEVLGTSYVRITKQGKSLPERSFTRRVVRPGSPLGQVVEPEKVFAHYHDGATISLNALDHFLPAVRQLLRAVTEPFACDGEAVAFLTPPGNPGFAPHTDPIDVFVVQIEGSKAWRIWDRADRGGAGLRTEHLGTPSMEITLKAGDVLYLPPLTPHAAAAQDDVSLHLGLSVEARRWRDLIHDCLDALMDDGYQESPYLGAERMADTAAGFATRLADLRARLASVDAAAELSRLAARPASRSVRNGFGAAVR